MVDSPSSKMLELPDDWWQRASTVNVLIELFEHHILGLLIGGMTNSVFQYSLYTGFLLLHGDELLWITAGHVVEEIDQILESHDFHVSVMKWLDGFDVPGAETVPVHRENLQSKSWKSEGIDVGVALLSPLDARNLLANKELFPIEETIWMKLAEASPEGYYLLGYPRAWNQFEERPAPDKKVLRSITANLACIPVIEIIPSDDATPESFWSNPTAFFGKIIEYPDVPSFDVDDLHGMSGGAIVSVERDPDGRIRYRLVGVVSKWLRSESIVRAEPIKELAHAIDVWLS
jgi:hypothetical protein